jgi:hypothetical protein
MSGPGAWVSRCRGSLRTGWYQANRRRNSHGQPAIRARTGEQGHGGTSAGAATEVVQQLALMAANKKARRDIHVRASSIEGGWNSTLGSPQPCGGARLAAIFH